MTIRVVCQCGKSYRVMVEHAGKVTKCKACGAPIQIPTVSEVGEQQTSQIPVGTIVTDDSPKPAPPKKRPPLPKNVADQWYLHAHDGKQYGPVPRSDLDNWLNEGLISAQCQLMREGDSQWQPATNVFPQLAGAAAPPMPTISPPTGGSSGHQALLTPTGKKRTMGNLAMRGELKKLPGVQTISSDVFHVGEPKTMLDRLKAGTIIGPIKISEVNIDSLQLFHFRDASGEFATIVPFDNGMIMPIEFVARISGCLPSPIVLLKLSGGKVALEAGAVMGGPLGSLLQRVGSKVESVWAGCDGSLPPVATAAQQAPHLSEGMRWEGKVGGGPVSTIHRLGWGVQALPISNEQFLLVAQSVPKQKALGLDFGVTWFCNYRRQFAQFVASLNTQETGQFSFLDPGVWLPAAAEQLGWVQW
jgi:hypothetical protein